MRRVSQQQPDATYTTQYKELHNREGREERGERRREEHASENIRLRCSF
jgi:hypothetical protein